LNAVDYNLIFLWLIFLWLIFLWDGRLARPGLGADKMSTPQELCRRTRCPPHKNCVGGQDVHPTRIVSNANANRCKSHLHHV